MNERIREIALQSKQYAREQMSHTMDPMLFSADVFHQKFAELIVRECISMADKESERYSNLDQEYCSMAMDNYMELVRQHFGVEE